MSFAEEKVVGGGDGAIVFDRKIEVADEGMASGGEEMEISAFPSAPRRFTTW